MRRRTLLATVGAGLAAGCSGSVPLLGPEDTPTDTDAPPEDGESTPESLPTETDESTATDTDPTEEPTETETPNRAERRGADVVGNARDLLGDAYDAYVGFTGPDADGSETGTATLLDVTVATEVTFSRVTSPVSEARSTLDDLPRRASGEQYDASRRLRGVATVLSQGIRCQTDLRDAYEEFEFVLDRIYADNTGTVPNALGRMRTSQSDAAGHLETIESETASKMSTRSTESTRRPTRRKSTSSGAPSRPSRRSPTRSRMSNRVSTRSGALPGTTGTSDTSLRSGGSRRPGRGYARPATRCRLSTHLGR